MSPTKEASIEDLLADILDDSKPITPAPAGKKPTPGQVALNVAMNTGNDTSVADLAMDNPETFLEGLLGQPDALAQPAGQPPLAAAGIPSVPQVSHTPGVTETSVTPPKGGQPAKKAAGKPPVPSQPTSMVSDDDFLAGILDGSVEPPVSNSGPVTEAGEVQHASAAAGVFTDTEDRTEPGLKPVNMPTFTAEDFAETMDIRSFATLVTLNTARWHAKVKDRQASQDAAAASDAKAEAFETRKHLLGGPSDMLKAIHRAIDEARAAHYEMTLPWSTTGMNDVGRRVGGRLLPNTLFVEYTQKMAEKKRAMTAALDAFEPMYPELVEAAKKKLGKRFDAREYPNVASIRQHFDLSFDFQPIPKGDDFKGLAQAQLDALAAKVNDNTRLMAENAMQDVWMRMYEAVAKMAERLSSPDKLFHNTLVQNVRDAARLAAHLNVAGDARVESIRKKIEKHLCAHEPKDLREKPTLRAQVAALAESIRQEMDK